jgi:hypothetical protein
VVKSGSPTFSTRKIASFLPVTLTNSPSAIYNHL